MSNPDIQPYELSDMRRAADKAPFDTQRKFHALLDAYEDAYEATAKLDEVSHNLETLKQSAADAVTTLRGVFPKDCTERPPFDEPLSEDAWHETLEDCRTPEELLKTVADEIERSRAAEAKLLARVEALEEAVGSALDELE